MKLQADPFDVQSINAYGVGWVAVNGVRHTSSRVIGSHGENFAWDCARFEDLSAEHFKKLIATRPELVLFGSGKSLRFARPGLQQALMQARIGFETMDTSAACRTYNILAGEGRHVVVALLVEA